MDRSLYRKAISIQKYLEEHFVDSYGCVYTFLDRETGRVPTDEFFADVGPNESIMDFTVPGFSRRDVAMYENCGMCTGAYLQALIHQYRVEKEDINLQMARRCFQALTHIYTLGKELETGFFPKIYGGRFSEETSSDQCLYAIFAMDNFYPFASEQEKKEIDVMIPEIADFWRKRAYRYNYWDQRNMQWPLHRFPVFMLLAYNHSNDTKFKKEYERLLDGWRKNYPSQFNLLGLKKQGKIQPNEYEQRFNAWIVSSMPDYMTMRMIELEYMLNHDQGNDLAPRWKQSILDIWAQAKLTLSPEGKAYSMILVDRQTGKIHRPEPCELRTSTMGWSSMIARGTVQALKFYPENLEMYESALKVLNALELEDLTYFDEKDRLPAKESFKTRFLSGDAITNWLWAYWQLRLILHCKRSAS